MKKKQSIKRAIRGAVYIWISKCLMIYWHLTEKITAYIFDVTLNNFTKMSSDVERWRQFLIRFRNECNNEERKK
jgi:hypothetical protein